MFCLDINPFACYLAETNLLIQVIDLLKKFKETGNLRECAIDRFNVYNIEQSGRYETLYEKWDLFVPFVELSCRLNAPGGKIGLIVSRGSSSLRRTNSERIYC